jgi:uncharacterized membrane protein YdjX (TVP38/TMEM64 family)
MKMSLYKLMGAVAVIGAVCLATAALLGNHDHGVRGAFEGISWFGFLACVAFLIVGALVALGRTVFRRVTTA